MPADELQQEIDSGVQFYGFYKGETLVAVMGIQQVKDVTLIRHAYTLTSQQRKGIGKKLLHHLLNLAKTQRILVGTWKDASWAVDFYQKHGFQLTTKEQTNRLLKEYWNIPDRQVETSVVLQYKRQQ